MGVPKKVDVATEVGVAAEPVLLAKTELAFTFARERVALEPAIWYPREPEETVSPPLAARVVVATFAKVFTPEKYGMFPTTAAVEVERPPKVMFGVAPPVEERGQVAVTSVTEPPPPVLVAARTRPPVALLHWST